MNKVKKIVEQLLPIEIEIITGVIDGIKPEDVGPYDGQKESLIKKLWVELSNCEATADIDSELMYAELVTQVNEMLGD